MQFLQTNKRGMMKKYEAYKDSGVEWIGRIPEGWKAKKIKNCSQVSSGSTPDTNSAQYWDGEISWITPADFKTEDHYVSFGRKSITKAGLDSCSTTLIPINSIVFSKRAPIGSVAITKNKLCTNQGCLTCIPNKESSVSFLYYAMSIFTDAFEMFGSGTTFKEISAWDFSNFELPYPPLPEQQAIASYLDHKVGQIDASVSAINTQIEDLKAYRQSIISEAVTKGLNPNVPMKDSGIMQVGMMNCKWSKDKMGSVCDVITDFVASGSFSSLRENVEYLREPDFAMLVRTADLSGSSHSKNKVYISEASYNFLKNSNLYGGEIILPNVGTVGEAYIVRKDLYPRMSLAPNSIMFKTKYCDKYYYYYFVSQGGKESLISLSNAAAQSKFNKTNLRELKVLLPPLSEQQAIASYLDSKTSKIDTAIATLEAQRADLNALKQSIISEAVTGKIDVRDWKPSVEQ